MKFRKISNNFEMETILQREASSSDAMEVINGREEIVSNYNQENESKSLNNGYQGSGTKDQLTCTEEYLEGLSLYKMNHSERGVALIFNHVNFENKILMPRKGAKKEGKTICETLEKNGFEVRYHEDLRSQEIEKKLSGVSKEDHSKRDCLLIVIMTYDDGGELRAFDKSYNEEKVWSYFTTEKVKSLGGKPKICLFQASPTLLVNDGNNRLKDSSDSPELRTLIIPSHADFLKIYSSVEVQNFSTDESVDSSFLQLLCMGLQNYASRADFISIVTKTLNTVKDMFPSDSTNPKASIEMPIVTSTLTRRLFLKPKSHIY